MWARPRPRAPTHATRTVSLGLARALERSATPAERVEPKKYRRFMPLSIHHCSRTGRRFGSWRLGRPWRPSRFYHGVGGSCGDDALVNEVFLRAIDRKSTRLNSSHAH